MMMYEHPNIQKSYKFSKILGDKVVKIAKSLLGVLSQDKFGVKKLFKKISKILGTTWWKKAKNLLGVLWHDKFGVKKIV